MQTTTKKYTHTHSTHIQTHTHTALTRLVHLPVTLPHYRAAPPAAPPFPVACAATPRSRARAASRRVFDRCRAATFVRSRSQLPRHQRARTHTARCTAGRTYMAVRIARRVSKSSDLSCQVPAGHAQITRTDTDPQTARRRTSRRPPTTLPVHGPSSNVYALRGPGSRGTIVSSKMGRGRGRRARGTHLQCPPAGSARYELLRASACTARVPRRASAPPKTA